MGRLQTDDSQGNLRAQKGVRAHEACSQVRVAAGKRVLAAAAVSTGTVESKRERQPSTHLPGEGQTWYLRRLRETRTPVSAVTRTMSPVPLCPPRFGCLFIMKTADPFPSGRLAKMTANCSPQVLRTQIKNPALKYQKQGVLFRSTERVTVQPKATKPSEASV